MSDLTPNQLSTLRAIAEAGTNYLRAKPKNPVYVQLASKGLVEYNPADVDSEGKHPYRLTPAGQAIINADTATAPGANNKEAPMTDDAPKFTLGVAPLPTVTRSGAGKSIYPFEQLKVDGPNSFFIPTGDRKNPSKSFGSIVSNQNRHAGFKKFTLRTIEDGAAWGHGGVKGVAVFILADEAPAEGDDE